jgi:AcrR family transcriptional regulator
MKKRNKAATKQLILDSALKLFAEKGFDGASISRIAKAAEVNQALIYYYFKNKKAVLAEILDTFISKANSFLIEIAVKNYEFGSLEMVELMEKYKDYFMRNEKTLRLLLTESLKQDYNIPPVFKLIDSKAENINEETVFRRMNEKGFNFDNDNQQRKVTEFFTGIMPMIIFSLFREKWSKYFGVSGKELDILFEKANEMTHMRHHLDD